MGEMTAKDAIEELQNESIKRWMVTPEREALALSIRALEICDKLGLLEGEEIRITNVCGTHHFFGKVCAAQDRDGPFFAVYMPKACDPDKIPQLIRELAAAWKFLREREDSKK